MQRERCPQERWHHQLPGTKPFGNLSAVPPAVDQLGLEEEGIQDTLDHFLLSIILDTLDKTTEIGSALAIPLLALFGSSQTLRFQKVERARQAAKKFPCICQALQRQHFDRCNSSSWHPSQKMDCS
jgi:hypothetical protein